MAGLRQSDLGGEAGSLRARTVAVSRDSGGSSAHGTGARGAALAATRPIPLTADCMPAATGPYISDPGYMSRKNRKFRTH